MPERIPRPDPLRTEFSIEQIELKGFSRSLAELEWLLLALVLLYYVAPQGPIDNPPLYVGVTVLYALMSLALRYVNLFQQETQWKLAVETWIMVAFITCLLWQTGKGDSPLLNLYLLVLIMSGLTLGKTTTILQLVLIAALYILGTYAEAGDTLFTLATLSDLMAKFAPFLLVTYLVTLLAADIEFSRRAHRFLSETDEMTGMQNRRAFATTLRKEFDRARRHQQTFSLLMIDADGLKPTNDSYGHAAGDRLIQLIAESIKSTLRGSDSYGRHGGDEFVALLPDTDRGRAREAAERIRIRVANTSFDVDGHRIESTVSVGIATYPEDAIDLEDLKRIADNALYRAKSGGKNRVVAADRIKAVG